MGDDVTANVRTIRSIPLRLRGTGYPESLEVRGEILLPFVEFDRLNAERHRADLPLFANPRNAASGTLKQLDPAIVAERRLDAYLYYVPGQPSLPDSHYERLQLCKSWGAEDLGGYPPLPFAGGGPILPRLLGAGTCRSPCRD